MLVRLSIVLLCFASTAASAADLYRPHRRAPTVYRVAEPEIVIGPVVRCGRTLTFIGTFSRCETGISSFNPTAVPGF